MTIRSKARQQIYRQLKEDLINYRIPPGQHLSIAKLSASFRLSNTPVREALIRLEGEHLAAIDSEGGFRARELNLGEMRELLDIARQLLPFCLANVPRRFASDNIVRPSALALQSRYRASKLLQSHPQDTSSFIETIFVELSRMPANVELARIITNICDRTHYMRVWDLRERQTGYVLSDLLTRLLDSLDRDDRETATSIVVTLLSAQIERLPDVLPKALAAAFMGRSDIP